MMIMTMTMTSTDNEIGAVNDSDDGNMFSGDVTSLILLLMVYKMALLKIILASVSIG